MQNMRHDNCFSALEVAKLTFSNVIISLIGGKRDYIFKRIKEDNLKEILELSPENQVAVWLLLLEYNFSLNSRLGTFFFTWTGDYAPEIGSALTAADIQPQASVFAEMISQFPVPYPDDFDVRYALSGWGTPEGAESDLLVALSDIAERFGTYASYKEQLEAYLIKNSMFIKGAEDFELSEEDLIRIIYKELSTLLTDHTKAYDPAWPRSWQLFYMINSFWLETLNGGVEQYFYNSSGDHADELVIALRETDLDAIANSVQEIVNSFPHPYPVDNNLRRQFITPNSISYDDYNYDYDEDIFNKLSNMIKNNDFDRLFK